MKILMVDKYFFVKGGAERYMFELSKVLKTNGHQIIPFAMEHPENFETPYREYFAPNIEYNGNQTLVGKVKTGMRAGMNMIYSNVARKNIERLVEKYKPDVAHLHMIDHQLSPSILLGLKAKGVPVIQTVHQYKLVCPNYRLYNVRTGQVCEKCVSGNFLHPIKEVCHRDSVVASTMVAVESALHRAWGIYDNIEMFHVPSRFIGSKFAESGVGVGKTRHLFYTIEIDRFEPRYAPGEYLLYFGRLAPEKGLHTLLRASQRLPGVPLYIVGDGPERASLEAYVRNNGMSQVTFTGNKGGQELAQLVKGARSVIVPSEWHDNSPLVIYESFAYGKPVIVSEMGGMPELVDHEKDGFLFAAGDVEQLSAQMRTLWNDAALAESFGRAGRIKAEREFHPQRHYETMHSWYMELIG